jgi:hypothetical protein
MESVFDAGCASTSVRALSDFDDVTVGIADVAPNLAVFRNRLREELRPSTLPKSVARSNIRHADIHEAAHLIRVGEDTERHRRLVRGRPAPDVDDEPGIRDLNVPRRALGVPQAQNAAAKDFFVVASRSLDVGDSEEMRSSVRLGRSLTTPIPGQAAHTRPFSIPSSVRCRRGLTRKAETMTKVLTLRPRSKATPPGPAGKRGAEKARVATPAEQPLEVRDVGLGLRARLRAVRARRPWSLHSRPRRKS